MYAVKIPLEDDFKVNPQADVKTSIEKKFSREDAIYLFDGTRHQNGWDVFEDFVEKGY